MSSKIEEKIAEIEEYLNDCKFQPLSNSKIIVNKDEIDELIEELKSQLPQEIRQYQKIISNKEAILSDAQQKADSIIAKATVKTNELVSEHQIMQQAYAQANDIVLTAYNQSQEKIDQATAEVNQLKADATKYIDDMLKEFEGLLVRSIDSSRSKFDNFAMNLQSYLDEVVADRLQLYPPEEPSAPAVPMQMTGEINIPGEPTAKKES